MPETKVRKNQNRVAVKDSQFPQLKETAKKEGRTMADIVEKALDVYFESEKNPESDRNSDT